MAAAPAVLEALGPAGPYQARKHVPVTDVAAHPSRNWAWCPRCTSPGHSPPSGEPGRHPPPSGWPRSAGRASCSPRRHRRLTPRRVRARRQPGVRHTAARGAGRRRPLPRRPVGEYRPVGGRGTACRRGDGLIVSKVACERGKSRRLQLGSGNHLSLQRHIFLA